MNVFLSLLQKMLIGIFLLVVLALAGIALFKKLLPESTHDTLSWQQVRQENTMEAYIEYMKECPVCRHTTEASAHLDALQKQAGLIARLDRTNLSVRDDFSALAFSPDGKNIVAAGVSRLHFWEAEKGEVLSRGERAFRLMPGRRVVSVRYSLGGKQIAAGTSTRTGAGTLMLWDAASGETLAEHPVQDHDIRTVAFAPRSIGIGWLADGPAGIWEPQADRIMQAIHEGATALSFVRDESKRLLMVTAGGRDVWLWNPETLEPLKKTELKTEKSLFGISHDGQVILYHDAQGIEVWNPLSGDLLAHRDRLGGELTAFCSDTRKGRLVLGTRDGMIHLWDIRKNTLLTAMLAHRNAVEELACSSRSRSVSRAIDGMKLWDVDRLSGGHSEKP